jgi:uncharacterized protein (DUF697 family)/predicted GTPase
MSESQAQQDEVERQIEQVNKESKRPTVLVYGPTGAGKTSLIQAILGAQIVSDSRIGVGGAPKTQDFDIFESDYIRLIDSKGLELQQGLGDYINRIKDYIKKPARTSTDIEDHVHICWYTINGAVARVQDGDMTLLKRMPPTLVVITKSDLMESEQKEGVKARLLELGVDERNIFFASKKLRDSLVAIVRRTTELMPDAYKRRWLAAQQIDLEAKRSAAMEAVHLASGAAGVAAGANPFPLSDALLIGPIQIGMTVRLAFIYGEPAEALKLQVAPLIASALGKTLASSLLKLIPIFGQVVNAGVAVALTQAMGRALVSYLEARAQARIDGSPLPEISAYVNPDSIAGGAAKAIGK